jgi:hypothetical protein
VTTLHLTEYDHPLTGEALEHLQGEHAVQWRQGYDQFIPAADHSELDVIGKYFRAIYPTGGTLNEADRNLAHYREVLTLRIENRQLRSQLAEQATENVRATP